MADEDTLRNLLAKARSGYGDQRFTGERTKMIDLPDRVLSYLTACSRWVMPW